MVVVEVVTIDHISEYKPILFAAGGSDTEWEIKGDAKTKPKISDWSYWVN